MTRTRVCVASEITAVFQAFLFLSRSGGCAFAQTFPPAFAQATFPPVFAPTVLAQTDSPSSNSSALTQSPTLPPTGVATTPIPTLSPTVEQKNTSVPTLQPVVAPTTTSPTVSPTENPTNAPSPSPTTGAPTTSAPTTGAPTTDAPTTDAPTTDAPTAVTAAPATRAPTTRAPSVSPSLSASGKPTPEATPKTTPRPTKSNSTRKPTQFPTASETRRPTGQPSAPSVAPIFEGPVLTGDISGARITLLDVAVLDESARTSFEEVMVDFLESAYNEQRRRQLRQLQVVEGVVNVEVTTVFRGQEPTDTGNTITYDQIVLYQASDPSVTVASIVSEPFNDPDLNEEFRDALRPSNTAFNELPDTAVAAPVISQPSDDEESDFTLYIIVICAAAGTLVIGIFAILMCRRRAQQDKPGSRISAQQPNSSKVGDDEDPPPPKRISNPNDRRIEEMYEDGPKSSSAPSIPDEAFEYQSVSTMGFDYNKVLAADYTVVSEPTAPPADSRPGMVVTANPHLPSQGSLTVDDTFPKDEPPANEQIFVVNAPSGMLGVVIVSPDEGPPVVHAIKESSVLRDKVRVGDKLLKVDNEDVTTMTAVRVSRLISQKSGSKRTFTLMRGVDS